MQASRVVRINKCLLCGRKLKDLGDGLQRHPKAIDCDVDYADPWGIAVDPPSDLDQQLEAMKRGEPAPKPAEPDDSDEPILIQTFPTVDFALGEAFGADNLERLGGASTGKGWSSYSTWQRCPYLWKRRYIEQAKPYLAVESPALAIGSLIHAFLSLHYTGMMDNAYRTLTPEMVYDRVIKIANPEFVQEAWRVFVQYRLYYTFEKITPLAVEYDLKDPRTGDSCRYDLIAWLDRDLPGLQPGTYIIEHKSSGRFDYDFLEGWPNDGEVIGQVALWKRCGLDKRFGELRGTIMNLLGRQKEPRFHRTYVSPNSWRVKSHLDDLNRIDALMHLARSTDSFPRSRANCINRYGRCEWYDHCASND